MIARFTLWVPFLLMFQAAESVESLSTMELAEHCSHFADDPEGKDAIFCVHYIQGFIDGAIATDERVAQNVAAEYESAESYTERAFRTRGPARLARFGPTAYADFCLGAPVPLAEVVGRVITDLSNRQVLDEQLLARDAVFYTLRKEYPCAGDEE